MKVILSILIYQSILDSYRFFKLKLLAREGPHAGAEPHFLLLYKLQTQPQVLCQRLTEWPHLPWAQPGPGGNRCTRHRGQGLWHTQRPRRGLISTARSNMQARLLWTWTPTILRNIPCIPLKHSFTFTITNMFRLSSLKATRTEAQFKKHTRGERPKVQGSNSEKELQGDLGRADGRWGDGWGMARSGDEGPQH